MFAIMELLKNQNIPIDDKFLNFCYAVCLPDTPKPLDPRPFGPDKPQEIFLFQDQLTNIKFEIEKILEWFQGNKVPQLDNKFINEFNSLIVGKDLPVKIPLKKSISLEEGNEVFPCPEFLY